jgi:hypothetical protein
MRTRLDLAPCTLLIVATGACVPDFDDQTSRVSEPRVLAISAFPAEAARGERVELTALVAAPGPAPTGDPSWSLCLDRKPLSELGPVSARCLSSPEPDSAVATPLGNGVAATATLPAKVCQLFGPERPDPKAGEPSGRPVDPDTTGGFYQPVLAWLDGTAVLGGIRLSCPLSGATREGTVDFNRRYRKNQNPELEAFELVRSDGNALALDADEPVSLAAGERVKLVARFAECPRVDACGDGICGQSEDVGLCAEDCTRPAGCLGAERYALYDRQLESVVELEESLVVSWFASAGELGEERSDRNLAEPTPAATNTYVAASAGEVQLWAVVRDDRGGVSWRSGRVRIE